MIVRRFSWEQEFEAVAWSGRNLQALKELIESDGKADIVSVHTHSGDEFVSYICFEILYSGGRVSTVYVPLHGYLVKSAEGWICGYDKEYFEENFKIMDPPRTRYLFVARMGEYKTCHEIIGRGTLQEAYQSVAEEAINDLFGCPVKDRSELVIKLVRSSEEPEWKSFCPNKN